MKIRTDKVLILMFFAFGLVHANAQEKKLKPNKIGKKSAGLSSKNETTTLGSVTETRYFLFPEFYHFLPVEKNDTTLAYECYDVDHRLIIVDTLRDFKNVQHIRFVKSFVDYTHTFIDAEGKPKPSTIKKRIYQYNRDGDDRWKCYEISTGDVSVFKESMSDIVRMDTTLNKNSVTGDNQMTIRKYYKVEKLIISIEGWPVE